MKCSIRIIVLFLAVVCAVPSSAQNLDDVEIKTTHVAGNVYMLEGAGGNIGVSVGEDGIVIIDDQFAPLADKIRAALKDIGGGDLAFILNTHFHGDHTSGNSAFGPEATIVAHDNVRKRLADAGKLPREGLPVITFDHGVSIHFNGEEIRAVHFPHGHTDGDCVVFFPKSNVVHMGDHMFSGMFPFVDLDGGGTVQGYMDNVGKVLARLPADAKVIPGHGPLSTVEDLKTFHAMLVETTGFVRSGVSDGKNLDELKASGLPERWEKWSWSFISEEKWIETIFKSDSK